jgi:hypothetical protein
MSVYAAIVPELRYFSWYCKWEIASDGLIVRH